MSVKTNDHDVALGLLIASAPALQCRGAPSTIHTHSLILHTHLYICKLTEESFASVQMLKCSLCQLRVLPHRFILFFFYIFILSFFYFSLQYLLYLEFFILLL